MTATGLISAPLQALANLLAACAAFQSWTGTADAAAALERIDVVLQTADKAILDAAGGAEASRAARAAIRPRAVIAWSESATGAADQQGGTYHAHEQVIQVTLERVCDSDESEADAILALLNAAGSIWDDLWETQATDDGAGGNFVTLHECRLIDPPARMDERDVAAGELDLYAMTLEFTVGER